jgi:thiamine-monophosphate kinase
MDVSDLGEFGLIERLRAALPAVPSDRLIAGIGDDAAVWRSGAGYTIATTDTLVAGVHFLPGAVAWRDVGWKALAVNVSDVAAMGGTPAFALVTLCLPPDTPVDVVDALYAGLGECADAYGVEIAGGDIVSSPVFAITIALIGDASTGVDGAPLLLRRDAARPGDVVAVTGALGGSAGGLRALVAGAAATGATRRLIERHMRPQPRIDAGRAAVAAGIACGIDISDGLAQDLGHICEASGVAAELRLDRIPLDADLLATFPDGAAAMAASGGEDYELLLVGAEDTIARAAGALSVPLTLIGHIVAGPPRVRLLDASGAEVTLASGGWDHLKKDGLA